MAGQAKPVVYYMMCGKGWGLNDREHLDYPEKTGWSLELYKEEVQLIEQQKYVRMSDKCLFYPMGSSWWILSNNWEELNDWKG